MTEQKSRTWEDHWSEGHTPWDAGRTSPGLESFLAQHEVPQGGRALVAGCGSGYDVFRLAKAGYLSTGIDIAPSVTQHFHEVREEWGVSADRATLVVGDFFELAPAELGGTFDLIWDYTFYCAIAKELRNAFRDQMARLLAPHGTLAMLLFPVTDEDPDEGPPFPLEPEEVTKQLSARFERTHLEQMGSTHPGREGKEWLSVWRPRP